MRPDLSLPPAPPPVSRAPPPKRIGGAAVVVAVAGWALLGGAYAWHAAVLAGSTDPAEWKRFAARLLLASSALTIVTSFVMALFALRRAVAVNALALVLCAGWLASIAYVYLQAW